MIKSLDNDLKRFRDNRFPLVDTGWRCAVCFDLAQVNMIDVSLCVKHAKRYNFGYGDSLASMREEFDGNKRKI